MAFNISDATYGRDSAGRKKLLTDLQGDIAAAIKVLQTEQQTVLGVVDKYWAGADATAFKKDFKKQTDQIASDFKQYSSAIETALSKDTKNFEKMQSQNSSKFNNGTYVQKAGKTK